jgi:hypothetical protein
MADLTSTLTVRLIDAVTAPARAAATSILGIGDAVDATNARRMAIGGAVGAMSRDVSAAAGDLTRNIRRMSSLSMPTGLATFFGARAVYDFEKTSNALQAVSGATDEQRLAIQRLAKTLNSEFPFRNAEIMGAAFELARAGFNPEQIKGALKDTLNLALAGDIELQDAAEIAVNSLTAMRLPMKTAEQTGQNLKRIADAVSYAANKSTTDVRLMGETMKYVAPMAAAAGMDVEQVAAAAMVMANNGIKGAEAGVAMRSALVRMVKPTNGMLGALARLNVDLKDFVTGGRQISANDVVRSLASDGIDATAFAAQIDDVLKDPELQHSLSAMTERLTDIIAGDGSIMDKTKLAESITDTLTAAGSDVNFYGFLQALREKGADLSDIARIFDARQGSRLITLLSGDLLGTLADVRANAPGSTDAMSKIMMKGVVGDWAALVASVENLFLSLADAGVLKTATSMIETLTSGLKSLAEANPQLLQFATYAVMIGAALGPIMLVGGGVLGFFSSLLSLLVLVARIGKGVVGIGAAALLGGGAAGAGQAGAAAGVAGAAAAGKAGVIGKLAKGAGAAGLAISGAQALDTADPEGNLWGLTKPVDDWVQRTFGFNPSHITLGGGGDKPTDQAPVEGAAPEAAPEDATAAAAETMKAYQDELERQMQATDALIDAQVARWKDKLNFTAKPVISPQLDGSAIRAVHADTGVE